MFFTTRPARNQLKLTGIVKERVFGCDLGEHLLNSGHDGTCTCIYIFIIFLKLSCHISTILDLIYSTNQKLLL
jgi:hypothetical protein